MITSEFDGTLNTKWNCFYYETECLIVYSYIIYILYIYVKNRDKEIRGRDLNTRDALLLCTRREEKEKRKRGADASFIESSVRENIVCFSASIGNANDSIMQENFCDHLLAFF